MSGIKQYNAKVNFGSFNVRFRVHKSALLHTIKSRQPTDDWHSKEQDQFACSTCIMDDIAPPGYIIHSSPCTRLMRGGIRSEVVGIISNLAQSTNGSQIVENFNKSI